MLGSRDARPGFAQMGVRTPLSVPLSHVRSHEPGRLTRRGTDGRLSRREGLMDFPR